jgi:phosphohistidine phosphatase SixA
MRLYIIRHAWAAISPKWPRQRPLTDDGQRRFRKVADTLGERGFAPQLVVTSRRPRATSSRHPRRPFSRRELHVLTPCNAARI